MAAVLRPVGYVGQRQTLIWSGKPTSFEAYLWGAGGGGGGSKSNEEYGGNGGGGAFSQQTVTINPGDVIDIAIGQGGRPGLRLPGIATGSGGQGLAYQVFDLRNTPGLVPVTNAAWSDFMNAHAAWDAGGPGVSPIFRSITVDFPADSYYAFQYSAESALQVTLDGTNIIDYSGATAEPPPLFSRFVTAGTHTLNLSATAGVGIAGVALTVIVSFSGANGGRGSQGVSGGGSGGGGGGATVLLVNNIIRAIAGGGGGGAGGGGGNTVGTSGPDAPGPWGWPVESRAIAQNGQLAVLGGGGGGGGGGLSGGNAGRRGGASPADPTGSSDASGTAGSYGESLGESTLNPSGRAAAGTGQPYYAGSSRGGLGGALWQSPDGQTGLNGYAAFEFDIRSNFYIRDQNIWTDLGNVYVYNENQWNTVRNVYVRENDQWQNVFSIDPPVFNATAGGFGQLSVDAF